MATFYSLAVPVTAVIPHICSKRLPCQSLLQTHTNRLLCISVHRSSVISAYLLLSSWSKYCRQSQLQTQAHNDKLSTPLSAHGRHNNTIQSYRVQDKPKYNIILGFIKVSSDLMVIIDRHTNYLCLPWF